MLGKSHESRESVMELFTEQKVNQKSPDISNWNLFAYTVI